MNKVTYNNVSKRRTIIRILAITMVMFLILVSIAGAGPFTYIPNSVNNHVSNLNKSIEAIKAFDKTIEINPQNSDAWYNKAVILNKLSKSAEAINAYEKAIEINPQLRNLAQ
jgi:tetratricopeptide (TPR) repeat protein